MTKTSTLQFIVNNLSSKAKLDLKDVNSLLSFEDEYAEVFEMLEELSLDVRQEVVDNILKFAADNE